jgi:hypothetical protein
MGRKTEVQCHSRSGTIKIPPCSKALSAELAYILVFKRIKFLLKIDGNTIQNNIYNVIDFNFLFVTETQ